LYKLWCAYNIGQNDLVFETPVNARNWAIANIDPVQLNEDGKTSEQIYTELLAEGRIGTQELQFLKG